MNTSRYLNRKESEILQASSVSGTGGSQSARQKSPRKVIHKATTLRHSTQHICNNGGSNSTILPSLDNTTITKSTIDCPPRRHTNGSYGSINSGKNAAPVLSTRDIPISTLRYLAQTSPVKSNAPTSNPNEPSIKLADIPTLQRCHKALNSTDVLQDWLHQYDIDQASFSSYSLLIESKLSQLQETYVPLAGRPNAVEAAVCCAILWCIPAMLGQYKNLFFKLAMGLQAAIYVPTVSEHESLSADEVSMHTLVNYFYSREPYFERIQRLEHQFTHARSLNDPTVISSVTTDELVNILRNISIEQLKTSLVTAYGPTSSSFITLLKSLLHAKHAFHRCSNNADSTPNEEEAIYNSAQDIIDRLINENFVVENACKISKNGSTATKIDDTTSMLLSSALICRAITNYGDTFSISGREMILASILEYLDPDSFSDVYKRFDVNGKADFLHYLSIIEDSHQVGEVIELLPLPIESLYQFYDIICNKQDNNSGSEDQIKGDTLKTSNDNGMQMKESNLQRVSKKETFLMKILGSKHSLPFLSVVATCVTIDQCNFLVSQLQQAGKYCDSRLSTPANFPRSNNNSVENGRLIIKRTPSRGHRRLDNSNNTQTHDMLLFEKIVGEMKLVFQSNPEESSAILEVIQKVLINRLLTDDVLRMIQLAIANFDQCKQLDCIVNILKGWEGKVDEDVELSKEMRAILCQKQIELLNIAFESIPENAQNRWLKRMIAPSQANEKALPKAKNNETSLEPKAAFDTSLEQKTNLSISTDHKKSQINDLTSVIPELSTDTKLHFLDRLLQSLMEPNNDTPHVSLYYSLLAPTLNGSQFKELPIDLKGATYLLDAAKIIFSHVLGKLPTNEQNDLIQKLYHEHIQIEMHNPIVDEVTKSSQVVTEFANVKQVQDVSISCTLLEPNPVEVKVDDKTLVNELHCLSEFASDSQIAEVLNAIAKLGDISEALTKLQTNNIRTSNNSVPDVETWHLHPKDSYPRTAFRPLESPNTTQIRDLVENKITASMPYMPVTESSAIPEHLTSFTGTKKTPLSLQSLLLSSAQPTELVTAATTSPRKPTTKGPRLQNLNPESVPKPISNLITSWKVNVEQINQYTKKPLIAVLKIINDTYSEALTARRRRAYAVEQNLRQAKNLTLAQIVYQSFLHSYGLPSIADVHLLAFSCALEEFRKEHLRVEFFARFIFEESPLIDYERFIMFFESLIIEDGRKESKFNDNSFGIKSSVRNRSRSIPYHTRNSAAKHIPRVAVPDKENWTISLDKVHKAVNVCFQNMRKVDTLAFCDKLTVISTSGLSSPIVSNLTHHLLADLSVIPEVSNPYDMYLNGDHVLQLVHEEWQNEQARRENYLLNAFSAGDVNGDGELTASEFTHIIHSIDSTKDIGEILLMYSDTLRRTECHSINPEIFLQVAKENNLDECVWNKDEDLQHIVNLEQSSMDFLWNTSMSKFFLGTLEALARDIPLTHHLRVCDGAGCGCLKCILDGYIGFQAMRLDLRESVNANPICIESTMNLVSIVWSRFWHLMRQLYEASAETDGVLTLWEGSTPKRQVPAPKLPARLLKDRRFGLPNILFPDTNRITGVSSNHHSIETYDVQEIKKRFKNLLDSIKETDVCI